MEQTPQGKWNLCLKYISEQLPEQTFRMWFSSLRFADLKGTELNIVAPNRFVIEQIENEYIDQLNDAIIKVFGEDVTLVYQLATSPESEEQPTKNSTHRQVAAPPVPQLDPHLSQLYTFENFVEGKSNKLARAVGLAIAKTPGKVAFSPFFLYGASGVGKTHLVNAIGLHIRELHPEARVLFVPAHLFKTQYTDSVLHNTTNEFIHFYQTIDTLIIDDIQEISTAKTQQAFFYILNHLQLIGKQIILTCDKPPSEFEGIEERMLTRFKSGMVVEMEKPDIALRRAILSSKIRRDGLSIPKKVIDLIATTVDSNVRELEGVINSLMAYSVVDDCDITMELAERIIARTVKISRKELGPDEIIRQVSQHTGIKPKEMAGKSRKQDIVKARQIAIFLIHKYTDLSFSQIGRHFGSRDHSTVTHACKTISNEISIDRKFRSEMENFETQLKNS